MEFHMVIKDLNMDLRKEAFSIYNSLPRGAKNYAAQDFGCTSQHFRLLLQHINTEETTILEMLVSIAEASQKLRKSIEKKDLIIQDSILKILMDYSSDFQLKSIRINECITLKQTS